MCVICSYVGSCVTLNLHGLCSSLLLIGLTSLSFSGPAGRVEENFAFPAVGNGDKGYRD